MLALASLAVWLLPFRALIRTTEWGAAPRPFDPADLVVAADMARAVRGVSRRIPWRTVCLHEGLALQWMLRWRGISSLFHFGISPGGDQLSAHVWVSLDGKLLIGEQAAETHTEVATFPRIH